MNVEISPLQRALEEIMTQGAESETEALLLWLIRSRFEVSVADSFEYVLPANSTLLGVEVNAAIVSQSREVVEVVYILAGDSNADLRTRAHELQRVLDGHEAPERELARSNSRLRSILEAAATAPSSDIVRVILCVTTQSFRAAERTRIERSGPTSSAQIEVLDNAHLEALARAAQLGDRSVPDVQIEAPESNVLRIKVDNDYGLVIPVYATAIADWPGIDDRTLFDLNVRHALGINRVRKSLDEALVDRNSASEFIAYHNGITAVCDSFSLKEEVLTVHGLSVVNGAQSVVAVRANQQRLEPSIQVLLKLIRAPRESDLARSIAIRSNTQNPVTSRNLRALDDVQERLTGDLAKLGYVYIARPDQDLPTDSRAIRNDDVAQLLCSMYIRKPSLAVKRQMLFENPLYSEVFPLNLDPARVVFAYLTRQVVQEARDRTPQKYQRAWALTALTAFYMTSEAMRADSTFASVLSAPGNDIRSPEALKVRIERYVDAAIMALSARANSLEQDSSEDDFRVAFKQSRTLSELGAQAAKALRQIDRESAS